METLVYISSTQQSMSQQEIQNILTASRRNNERNDITGVLLYAECGFIQVLEGRKHHIDQTYRKILCDPRHNNILVLYREAVNERSFPQWVMACQEIKNSEDYDGLFTLNQKSLSQLDLKNARRDVYSLLQSFLLIHAPYIAA